MGDRANIKIAQGDGRSAIYLYTHWGGYKLPETLIRALARKERWDDEPYLTRMIASEVIRDAGGLDMETGSGITTYMTDGEYAVIEVRVKDRTVKIKDTCWSFDEFILPENHEHVMKIWEER